MPLDFCTAVLTVAQPEDIPALAAIDACSNSHPWREADFAAAFREGHLCLTARDETGAVIGFAVGRALPEEAELLLIAVDPGQRRAGVGRLLLTTLEARLAAAGARAMHLEVRASNHIAQRFYAALGYTVSGRRPGYYPAGAHASMREDAILMTRSLVDVGASS
ncbi:MAG: ribosomal protein S18-alanine N-acetyltransferase [Casimicrobiaceae bacterium]